MPSVTGRDKPSEQDGSCCYRPCEQEKTDGKEGETVGH